MKRLVPCFISALVTLLLLAAVPAFAGNNQGVGVAKITIERGSDNDCDFFIPSGFGDGEWDFVEGPWAVAKNNGIAYGIDFGDMLSATPLENRKIVVIWKNKKGVCRKATVPYPRIKKFLKKMIGKSSANGMLKVITASKAGKEHGIKF